MKQLISLAFALALLTVCTSPPYPWPAARPPAPAAVAPSPTTAARPTARPQLAALPARAPTAPAPTPPAPTPAPPTPAPLAPGLAALRDELGGMVASWGGDNAVSVADLQTGQTISVNGSRPQLAACTIKIGIMLAVAQDIEAGRYAEADVADLVQSAMGPSNTPPARELIALAGGGDLGAGLRRINQIMWDLGATNLIITHPPGYAEEEYGYAASRGVADNLLTTDDLVLLLGKLYRGQALSPWATGYVLQSMTIAPDWMNGALGGALPPEAQLYHKVGQLYDPQNTWNDAGIVTFERNGRTYAYAIAYLGSYGGGWEEAYAHATSVSEAAWRYFSAAYGQG
ncbi:MAG TPA: serine hydrolase [Roseiflexaceae bacterium]